MKIRDISLTGADNIKKVVKISIKPRKPGAYTDYDNEATQLHDLLLRSVSWQTYEKLAMLINNKCIS